MNQSVANRKCVVLCLLSFVFGAVTACGGTNTKAPKTTVAGAEGARVVIVAAENQRALKAYEKRNAEITPWTEESAVSANTDNAALLYYQAFLFIPEPNEAMRYEIRPGAGPSKQIRTYLGYCLPVIQMIETASRIPGCTWAVWPESGPSWAPLRRNLGLITDIILVDAGTLAVDGHYRVALERCLTIRRLARHLNDDPELYIYSTGPDTLALNTIRDVFSLMPPDVDILTWFRGQFAVVLGPSLSSAEMVKPRVRRLLIDLRTTPDSLRLNRKLAVQEAEGEKAKENVRTLTDEQFLSRASEGLARFTDSILRIIDSEMTHEQKLAQMHKLFGEPLAEDDTDPVVKAITGALAPAITAQIDQEYRFRVAHKARVNGIKAAVEVYLILAKTGRLPKKLPDHLPKDPFTGRDFGYEITTEGFALRCQGEKSQWWAKQMLEFKVQK